MKVRDYKFESKEELDLVANTVLLFNGTLLRPEDVDYSSLVFYKQKQLEKLLDGKYDITPRDLMMYLSCPIGIENKNDITNFGIRTSSIPGNGRLNMFLSDKILFHSLVGFEVNEEYIERVFDFELDRPTKLVNKDDLLEYYAPSMLEDSSLLYYLFLTGRGEEFTRVYNDTPFLSKLEKGEFTEEDIKKRMPEHISDKSKASDRLKRYVDEDKYHIEYLSREKESQIGNKTLK